MKSFIKKIPFINSLLKLRQNKSAQELKIFEGSERYWISRYESGKNSGMGSYNHLATFKADIINNFVVENNINSVIEYGCGDGNQLKLARYNSYIGFDVSDLAISLCRNIFSQDSSKIFKLTSEYNADSADLTLSLDVTYHLIEDDTYHNYLNRLFSSSEKFVIIYSSDTNVNSESQPPHVKHRSFTKWVAKYQPHWTLIKHIPNKYPYNGDYKTSSFADFYIFCKHS